MHKFKRFVFEEIPITCINIPCSKEEVFNRLEKNVIITNSIPITLRKRSYNYSSLPYYSGIVSFKKNKIELLFNPFSSNTFVRLSAHIVNESTDSCTLIYEFYRGGLIMDVSRFILLIFIFIWSLNFYYTNFKFDFIIVSCFLLLLILLRIFELSKILLDKRLSTTRLISKIFGLSILTLLFVNIFLVFGLFQLYGKIIWQYSLFSIILFILSKTSFFNYKPFRDPEEKFLNIVFNRPIQD